MWSAEEPGKAIGIYTLGPILGSVMGPITAALLCYSQHGAGSSGQPLLLLLEFKFLGSSGYGMPRAHAPPHPACPSRSKDRQQKPSYDREGRDAHL
ncbi:hypothetical protein BDV09DRAFT_178151 [Aspergillus tetrazonus]